MEHERHSSPVLDLDDRLVVTAIEPELSWSEQLRAHATAPPQGAP